MQFKYMFLCIERPSLGFLDTEGLAPKGMQARTCGVKHFVRCDSKSMDLFFCFIFLS
jgi:hypothetical protein